MSASDEALCQACGACCAYSADWPRFGLETEEEIEAIPREYVDDARGTMLCNGNRCMALTGEVGVATGCRSCQPGDDSCTLARRRFMLPELSVPAL